MLLVKYKDNWADEINIEGAFLITKELWEIYLNLLDDYDYQTCEIFIGTNESIEYYTKEHYLKHFTVEEVSETEASILSKIIPNNDSLSYLKYFGVCALIEIEE